MKLSVFGFGGVGRTLSKQAIFKGASLTGIADSTGIIVKNDLSKGIDLSILKDIEKKKEQQTRFSALDHEFLKTNSLKFLSINEYFQELANPDYLQNLVLADCSAHGDAETYLLKAQEIGVPVALANKKPLSTSLGHFRQLTEDRSLIGYESTVGAGLPTICTLRRLLDANDKPVSIKGCLSGSLGYLLSALEKGEKFSTAVLYAKDKGFLEPDPRDDLSGMDVARKAVILARTLGSDVNLDDLNVESLYTSDLADLPLESFLTELHKLDAVFVDKVEAAKGRNKVLRYLATIKVLPSSEISVKVGLEEVESSSVLGRLQGTDNCLVYETGSYNKNAGASELVITGPGAGREVTAQGVLADCIGLCPQFDKTRYGI